MTFTVFLHSLVTVHSTFIVRQVGASAAQLAYVLPPPPTVVGAFMNPLARMLGLGEEVNRRAYGAAGSRVMHCALKATLAAAAGLAPSSIGVAVHAEPSRIIGAPYKAGGSYQKALKKPPYEAADELLPVQAVGYTSAPLTHLHLAWLVNVEALSKCLGAELSVKEMRRAVWSVYRIGSREGLVSVLEASVYEPEDVEVLVEGSRFRTLLYQPESCSEPLAATPPPKIVLYDLAYREARFVAVSGIGGPVILTPPTEPLLFALRSGCSAARPRAKPELTLSYPASTR